MKSEILIIAITLTIFVSACQQINKPNKQIDSYTKNEEYQSRIKKYLENKEKYDSDPQLLNDAGVAFHHLEEYANALDCFDKAIRLAENHAELYSNKGLALIELGNYEDGIALCNKAMELDSDYPTAYINRSSGFIKLQKWELALDDLNKVLVMNELKHEFVAIVYANLGTVYLNLSEFEKAIQYTDKAIEMNEQLYWTYLNRAFLSLRDRKLDEAMKDVDKGLQLKPKHILLNYYKGILLLESGKTTEGCAFLSKSLKLIEDVEDKNYLKISSMYKKHCND